MRYNSGVDTPNKTEPIVPDSDGRTLNITAEVWSGATNSKVAPFDPAEAPVSYVVIDDFNLSDFDTVATEGVYSGITKAVFREEFAPLRGRRDIVGEQLHAVINQKSGEVWRNESTIRDDNLFWDIVAIARFRETGAEIPYFRSSWARRHFRSLLPAGARRGKKVHVSSRPRPLNLTISHPEYGDMVLDEVGHYADETPAIRVYGAANSKWPGEPIAVLTICVDERPKLGPSEFVIKTWSENASIAAAVLATGFFVDTGRRCPAGFTQAEIWRLV